MAGNSPSLIGQSESFFSALNATDGGDQAGENLATAGGILSIGGALMGAVGSFYEAKNLQIQLRSQALSEDYRGFMANLDARAAEREAQEILLASEQQIGLLGLQAAQARGSRTADVGAAGIQAGVGSAAEVAASQRLAQRLDAMALRTTAARQAGEARMRGVNAQSRAGLAAVSGENLRASARTMNPLASASTSLLGAASQAANYWAYSRRRSGY